MADYRHRGPRKKTKSGCATCKRRKVKCDEGRPTCANCIRFRVPCGFDISTARQPRGSIASGGDSDNPPGARRPRGRPRKDWSFLSVELVTAARTEARPQQVPGDSASSHAGSCSLNVADAELLLQFVSHTSATLAVPADPDNSSISRFWAHNAPRIGLTFRFVLHLASSLAARHLLYLESGAPGPRRREELTSLAERHLSAGVAEMTVPLASLDTLNCGALYVSSMLVCYNIFAAGPKGPGDLLVCNVSQDQGPRLWIPLIRGVHLIRAAFPTEVLFSGLTAPLHRQQEDASTFRPSFIRDKFERIEWTAPLGRLRALVASCNDLGVPIRLRALDSMEPIYVATYGRDEAGLCDVPPIHRFVFIWIYWLEDDFLACLQRRDPASLLILACYAVLLRTMRNIWFMNGWTEHILTNVWQEIKGDVDMAAWMEWPLTIAGLPKETETKEGDST